MGRRWDWQETDLSRAWRTIFNGAASAIRSMATILGEAWAQFVSRPFQDSSAFSTEAHPVAGHRQTVPSLRTVNLEAGPDDRVAEAQARVIRLQAAVDLLGEDNPDAASLKTMLAEAKAQTRVAPIGERLDACLKFIERAKKRLESAEQGFDQGTGSQSCSRNRVVGGFGKFAAIAMPRPSTPRVSRSREHGVHTVWPVPKKSPFQGIQAR